MTGELAHEICGDNAEEDGAESATLGEAAEDGYEFGDWDEGVKDTDGDLAETLA